MGDTIREGDYVLFHNNIDGTETFTVIDGSEPYENSDCFPREADIWYFLEGTGWVSSLDLPPRRIGKNTLRERYKDTCTVISIQEKPPPTDSLRYMILREARRFYDSRRPIL